MAFPNNALVNKNNELVAANAKLQRTVGQMEGKLAGKENAYASLLNTVSTAIARDPSHVSEEDLQKAKANSRFWQDTTWIPYTQGQELFAYAKKEGVPLYFENADGTTIDPDHFNLIKNAQWHVWQTLKDEGKLPSKWGQRSTYAEDLHARTMGKFREFKYCANDYKRHRFATDRYSGWFRTHGKSSVSPGADDSDDDGDDSPISPTVDRKRSMTMPPPEATSSNKRAKSSTPAAHVRASTVQPTSSVPHRATLTPRTHTRTAPPHPQSVHDREDEDEDESGGDTELELDSPTTAREVVHRSSSLNRPGPNQSAVVRLVDLTDPAKRQELQNKLRRVADPCARVPRAPMPPPLVSASEQDSSGSQATAGQPPGSAGPEAGAGDSGGSKLRISKKSNTARNLAAAAYKRVHPGVTTYEFSVHWISITKPDRANPEYEAKVEEYTLIEARRLFALAYLSTHPAALVDELLDEFAKLTPDDVKKYCERAAEAVAKELSKGQGKGKEKA